MMRIYIVRHGETAANTDGRLAGWLDEPLNETGRELARQTGRALKDIRFDAAFSSSLSRAAETAHIILKEAGYDLPLTFDDRLREICMGDYEGLRMCDADPVLMRAFMVDPLSAPPFPNGECAKEVTVRTQAALRDIAAMPYRNVLIATHGGALRCMLNFLYTDKTDFWHGHVPLNCCVNIIETDGDAMRLIADDLILYDEGLRVDRYQEIARESAGR